MGGGGVYFALREGYSGEPLYLTLDGEKRGEMALYGAITEQFGRPTTVGPVPMLVRVGKGAINVPHYGGNAPRPGKHIELGMPLGAMQRPRPKLNSETSLS